MSEPKTTLIKCGDYEVQACTVKTGINPPFIEEDHLWIQHKDGEGMSVSPWVLHRFFKENF